MCHFRIEVITMITIHNIDESLNLGDIQKISCYDKLKNIDLLTHG